MRKPGEEGEKGKRGRRERTEEEEPNWELPIQVLYPHSNVFAYEDSHFQK